VSAFRRPAIWIALGLLLAGCRLVSLDGLIFFPERGAPAPPAGVRERWLTAADGVRLHAWLVEPPVGAPTLIWSHGNGGNVAGRAEVLLALASRGVGILAYDYRGYGRSDGRPSEAGVYRDAEAAYDQLRADGVPASHIVAFGESLGGAVSIHLAASRPCAGVAVVSTFTRLRDVARVHYGVFASLAGNRFDSLARVSGLSVPIFVAHGDQDDLVPFVLGEQLFEAARPPRRFLPVAGAGHNDIFDSVALLDAIAGFARETTRVDTAGVFAR
jgi:fermentation-respiration switch protein FrsA (DUF1100 family)